MLPSLPAGNAIPLQWHLIWTSLAVGLSVSTDPDHTGTHVTVATEAHHAIGGEQPAARPWEVGSEKGPLSTVA